MNRRGNKQYLEELFPRLRARIPGLVLRTSLIAGLPGEGEPEFEELCDFLRRQKLERVGAFAFSPEEGTPAARMDYPDAETAARRAELIAQLQSRIMDEYNAHMQGRTVEVLCEGYDPEQNVYFGRTCADSPDIDGTIRFTSESAVETGDFVNVQVTGAVDGDLTGRMAGEAEQ